MKKFSLFVVFVTMVGFAACTENSLESANTGMPLEFTPYIVSTSDWNGTRSWQSEALADVVRLTADGEQPLYLHVTEEPRMVSAPTRAQLVEGTTLPTSQSFGVSGYRYTSASTINSATPNFFYNAEVAHNGVNWLSTEPYYIPTSSEKLAFCAYWPYDATTTTLSNNTVAGPLTIDYTVNTADITAQKELLTASVTDLNYDDSPGYRVPLQFRHALTAIRIELSEDVAPGHLRHISIMNVGINGTHTIGGGWTINTTGNLDVDYTNNNTTDGYDTSTLTGNTELLGGTKTLLMIPQTFAATDRRPCLYFEIDDGTTIHPLYYYLGGSSWQAGTQVTYRISTSSINMVKATMKYPENWGGDSFGVKTAYTTATDTIGFFAVDASGKIAIANAYYVNNGASWQRAEDSEALLYKSDYEYFAYYPYRASLTGAPTVGTSVGTGLTADAFFNDIINGWTVTTDQSTLARLSACDLQVGKGIKAEGKFAYNFSMTHKMGLAVLTLEQATLPTDKYYLNSDDSYTWTNGETIITASSDFTSASIPCQSSTTNIYYYIIKTGTSATFSATASTEDDEWSSNVSTSSTIVAGGSAAYTALLKRTSTHFTEGYINLNPYTINVGDVYFSDGALGKTYNAYPDKTAVGLVSNVNPSAEDKSANWTHGYVMALRDVRNTNGTIWDDYWATGNAATTSVTDMTINSSVSATQIANIKNDKNGLKHCNTALSGRYASQCTAIKMAKNFNVTAPGNSKGNSGWYLPSIGQLWDWFISFTDGYITTTTSATWRGSNANDFYYSQMSSTAASKMNTYFKNKVGSGNFDTYAKGQFYWSSTERINTVAFILLFNTTGSYGNVWFDALDTEHKRGITGRVRPMLAF